MAKIIKKKKRFKFGTFINIFALLSLFAFLGTATLLRSYNVSLSYELSEQTAMNEDNTKKLDTLRLDVAKYTEKEYLMSMSNQNGGNLKLDQNNIVRINNENE